MKTMQTSLTAALIATTLSLPLAGVALATESSAAPQPLLVAAKDNMDKAEDAVSDSWITTKVKSALLANDATPGMDIKVETKNGIVSLSGVVPTEAQREAAIAEAKSTKGVHDVMADGLKTAE